MVVRSGVTSVTVKPSFFSQVSSASAAAESTAYFVFSSCGEIVSPCRHAPPVPSEPPAEQRGHFASARSPKSLPSPRRRDPDANQETWLIRMHRSMLRPPDRFKALLHLHATERASTVFAAVCSGRSSPRRLRCILSALGGDPSPSRSVRRTLSPFDDFAKRRACTDQSS